MVQGDLRVVKHKARIVRLRRRGPIDLDKDGDCHSEQDGEGDEDRLVGVMRHAGARQALASPGMPLRLVRHTRPQKSRASRTASVLSPFACPMDATVRRTPCASRAATW